jgi:hypothetical protein
VTGFYTCPSLDVRITNDRRVKIPVTGNILLLYKQPQEPNRVIMRRGKLSIIRVNCVVDEEYYEQDMDEDDEVTEDFKPN